MQFHHLVHFEMYDSRAEASNLEVYVGCKDTSTWLSSPDTLAWTLAGSRTKSGAARTTIGANVMQASRVVT